MTSASIVPRLATSLVVVVALGALGNPAARAQTGAIDPREVSPDALRDALGDGAEEDGPAPLDAESGEDRPPTPPPTSTPPPPPEPPVGSWLRGTRDPNAVPVPRPTTGWHGGVVYGRLLADGYVPSVSFGLSLRPGLAVGFGYRLQTLVATGVVYSDGTPRRFLEPRFSFQAELVAYPRAKWFHLGLQLGPLALTDPLAPNRERVGLRAGALLGGEWHRVDPARQHWGLGLGLAGGLAYVDLGTGPAAFFDGAIVSTATWY